MTKIQKLCPSLEKMKTLNHSIRIFDITDLTSNGFYTNLVNFLYFVHFICSIRLQIANDIKCEQQNEETKIGDMYIQS